MERNITLDFLKVILAMMVVGLHSGFLSDMSTVLSYLSVNGIFRVAVPLFFMINGLFFYDVLSNNNQRKWFLRIFSLYSFWMLFYVYFWFRPETFNFYNILKIVKTLVVGYHHLWYLPGTIGAAILILMLFKKNTTTLIAISLALYTTGLFLQYAGNYSLLENQMLQKIISKLFVYRNFLFFGFPFFTIGYLIKKYNIKQKITKKHLVLLVLFGLMLLLIESYTNYAMLNGKQGFDILISLLFVCPAILILILKLEIKSDSKNIALVSTGIYVVHPFLLSIGNKFFSIPDTLLTAIVIAFSFVASYILIKVNMRFRYIL